MRKVVLLAAALVVALGISASSATSAATETGVTARPEIGLPLPSTTVTTDGSLTEIAALVQEGWVQWPAAPL